MWYVQFVTILLIVILATLLRVQGYAQKRGKVCPSRKADPSVTRTKRMCFAFAQNSFPISAAWSMLSWNFPIDRDTGAGRIYSIFDSIVSILDATLARFHIAQDPSGNRTLLSGESYFFITFPFLFRRIVRLTILLINLQREHGISLLRNDRYFW